MTESSQSKKSGFPIALSAFLKPKSWIAVSFSTILKFVSARNSQRKFVPLWSDIEGVHEMGVDRINFQVYRFIVCFSRGIKILIPWIENSRIILRSADRDDLLILAELVSERTIMFFALLLRSGMMIRCSVLNPISVEVICFICLPTPMAHIINPAEIMNWNTTSAFRKFTAASELENFPFNTLIGLNAER
jgi:hypothetical protein